MYFKTAYRIGCSTGNGVLRHALKAQALKCSCNAARFRFAKIWERNMKFARTHCSKCSCGLFEFTPRKNTILNIGGAWFALMFLRIFCKELELSYIVVEREQAQTWSSVQSVSWHGPVSCECDFVVFPEIVVQGHPSAWENICRLLDWWRLSSLRLKEIICASDSHWTFNCKIKTITISRFNHGPFAQSQALWTGLFARPIERCLKWEPVLDLCGYCLSKFFLTLNFRGFAANLNWAPGPIFEFY